MTPERKKLIDLLLRGFYLKKWTATSGIACYRLYDPAGNPVKNIRSKTVEKLDRKLAVPPKSKLWKFDKKTGVRTLNLNVVRRLNGNSVIKKYYKQLKN